MILFQSLIPLNPKTKKNSQEIRFRKAGINGFFKKTKYGFKYVGIPFIAQSESFEQYEKECRWFLRKPPEPISEPVNVKCIFYRDSERRCDLTNLLEAVDDILVNAGILKDDNFKVIISHDGSRVFVDKIKPRTEITIESIENPQQAL